MLVDSDYDQAHLEDLGCPNLTGEINSRVCTFATNKNVHSHAQTNTHLGESSDSVLIGEEWGVIADLEVEVNCLVSES